MSQKQPSITEQLERQAKEQSEKASELKPEKRLETDKNDALRLGWRDVVIFSILAIFSTGYWL